MKEFENPHQKSIAGRVSYAQALNQKDLKTGTTVDVKSSLVTDLLPSGRPSHCHKMCCTISLFSRT